MSTTGGFGGEGPVVVPTPRAIEETIDDRRERPEVEDASPDEVAEEAAVVAHLEDPEVDAAIERLRAVD